jgi:TM2 domain-containing membrane protein YozV
MFVMSIEQYSPDENRPPDSGEDLPPPPPSTLSQEAETPPPVPVVPSPAQASSTPIKDKKLLVGILAIVLGALGIHKFILGYQKEGIIMCVIGVIGWFICGIPTLAIWIIGLIEGIGYLTKTDEEFENTYIIGRKPWF